MKAIIVHTNLHHLFTLGHLRGLALWPFVFIKDKEDRMLLLHELVHFEQQKRDWVIWFYIKYLYYNIRYGYWDNPYEVEARLVAQQQYKEETSDGI